MSVRMLVASWRAPHSSRRPGFLRRDPSGEEFSLERALVGVGCDRSSVVKFEMSMKDQTARAAGPEFRLFYDAFKATPIGIVLATLEGNLLFANPALCSMLGFSEEEIRSKNWIEFSPPEDASRDQTLFAQLRAGLTYHYHLDRRCFRSDGSFFAGHWSVWLMGNRASPVGTGNDYGQRTGRIGSARERRTLSQLGQHSSRHDLDVGSEQALHLHQSAVAAIYRARAPTAVRKWLGRRSPPRRLRAMPGNLHEITPSSRAVRDGVST